MKRKLLSVAALLVSSVLGIGAYVHYFDQHQSEKLLAQSQLIGKEKKIAKVFYDNGCQYCHTTNAELPFYSKFPIVDKMVETDIKKAHEFSYSKMC